MEDEKKTVNPIVLSDGVNTYTLEFNRDSIVFAEQRGFRLEDVADYPMSKLPELFFYAFRMHHKNIAKDKTDKILFGLGGIPDGMVDRLCELYQLPFDSLSVVDEDGEERKNSKWKVEF